MRNVHVVVSVVLALLLPSAARAQDEELVRRAFAAYKTAILQQDGESAVALVNKATLEYYAHMMDMALEAPEPDVRRLTPVNKIMVLSLRHRVPIGDLRSMTPERLVTYAVDEGWIGKNSVIDSEIGDVQVFNTDASADYIKGGDPTPLKYRFSKENGDWKIDLTALMPMADQAMSTMIKERGFDEDAFIVSVLESVSGMKVSPSLWQPPGR